VGLASLHAAIEYLWRTGHIAVTRRDGFSKVYDLIQNVIPATYFQYRPSAADSTDWACHLALRTLGFATPKEIEEFYDFFNLAKVSR